MLGNKNVLGKHWKWNKESVEKRKKEWKGKTWAKRTQFKKGIIPWNRGKKMPNSMSAKMKIIASQRIGEKAANWIDGRSFLPYPSIFNRRLKESIKKRDGYKCRWCGVKEKNYFQKLSIHHLDYNKNNCNLDNLITLCRSCNAKANAKNHRERATTIIGHLKG